MKKISLHTAIFLSIGGGLLYGAFLPQWVYLVSPLGVIFLKLLKLIVVPLVFISIIDGISCVSSTRRLSRLSLATFLFYACTSAFAVLTGLVLVNLIRPGEGVTVFGSRPEAAAGSINLMDFIPDNVFSAFARADTLQIILIAILIGTALVALGDKASGLRRAAGEANELFLKISAWILALAPVGIFGLMADLSSSFDVSILQGVAKFAVTIIAALLVHGCFTLPVLFKLLTKRPLLRFISNMQPALTTAFSTSSSSATLPITMECIEKEEKISRETAGFVLPVGATLNMDGTAIYEASACLFIAQAIGIDLSLGQQIVVFFTAALAAAGAASIPSAGLITLAIVLTAVNLPLEGIGFLLAFDRPLDMARTVVNVWGDMVGCAVLEEQRLKEEVPGTEEREA